MTNKTIIALKFDDQSVYQRFMENNSHPILTDLIYWCFASGIFSEEIVTSFYRKGDPGVHGTDPVRGIDIRSHQMVNPEEIADKINSHWQYDSYRPKMKCAIYHDVGRGPHIHLQVHSNTVLIKGGW